MRSLGLTSLLVVVATCSCSSTSKNPSNGTGGSATGGAAGASGGSGGVGGGSGGAAGSAGGSVVSCMTDCAKGNFQGAQDFNDELSNFVCTNSPCEAVCPGVCGSTPQVAPGCAQCIVDQDLAPKVGNACQTNGRPDCVTFAQCYDACVKA